MEDRPRARRRLARYWWLIGIVVGLCVFGAGVALIAGGGNVPLGIVLFLAGLFVVVSAIAIRFDLPLTF